MSDLLPANASQQERDISLAIERAGTVPVVVREVWNPDTCPANLLPWLAWAFSVDEWSDEWTESQKRGAIKASVEVHKRKGTIGALRTALDGIGFDFEIDEWFTRTPVGTPYTFGVTIYVDQAPLPNVPAIAAIESLINDTKNVRSHLDGIGIVGRTNANIYAGSVVLMGETVNLSAEPNT